MPSVNTIIINCYMKLAYCTTSTTLISGAMAERCKFTSYLIFISVATAIYCVPAAWLWNPGGWLAKMGAVDIGGSGKSGLDSQFSLNSLKEE